MSKSAKKRSGRHDPSGEGRGGVMSSMRGGFKGMVGQGTGRRARTPMQKIWDALFWVVILALLGFFAYRRFR